MTFYSFTEEFKKRGLTPRAEVLEFFLQIPNRKIRKNLRLVDEHQQVYYIKRLRYADDELVAIESTYLPAQLFPELKEEDLNSMALYDIMRDNYGIMPRSAEESFGATLIGDKDSVYFSIEKGAPALDIERFTYANDTCIEYTAGIIRGDKFRFHVKLN